jgi:hypothetical protein
MEQGCGTSMDTATVATDLSANDALPSWENDPVQHLSPRHTQDATGSGATNNYSSSIGSQSGTWPTSEATEQDIMLPALRGERLFQLCPCKCFADTNCWPSLLEVRSLTSSPAHSQLEVEEGKAVVNTHWWVLLKKTKLQLLSLFAHTKSNRSTRCGTTTSCCCYHYSTTCYCFCHYLQLLLFSPTCCRQTLAWHDQTKRARAGELTNKSSPNYAALA